MAVRKRTWFTRLQLQQIEPKAKALVKGDRKPDAWKTYIDQAAAALDIERNQAWVVDYADQDGDRHIETFEKKADADKRHAEVTVAVGRGTHTAPSKSLTVSQACGKLVQSGQGKRHERTRTCRTNNAPAVSPACRLAHRATLSDTSNLPT